MCGALWPAGRVASLRARAHLPPPGGSRLRASAHLPPSPLQALAYRATRDGWGAADFHAASDRRGPVVVVGETEAGARFGGFHSAGFASTDDYFSTMASFLFAWPSKRGGEPVKCEKIGGPDAAIYDFRRGGPQWGADALAVGPPAAPVMGGMAGPDTNAGCGDLRGAKCRLGLDYAPRPDGLTLFGGDAAADGGRDKATLVEVEAYYAPEIAALY